MERDDGTTAVTIINLTPHDVVLMRTPNSQQTFPVTGMVARLVEKREQAEALLEIHDTVSPIETTYITYGEIAGLPESVEDTYYIVSALVGPIAALMGRHDCLAPDTGRAIRENGAIVGVPGFVRF